MTEYTHISASTLNGLGRKLTKAGRDGWTCYATEETRLRYIGRFLTEFRAWLRREKEGA